jgi:sec-independent protein translocase protein TatA
MFTSIGMKEIIIIAVILLILFGSKKIPELSRNIVDAIRHLRGAFKDTPIETDSKKK